MWGDLLPRCFCVATTPLIMSQHSQVVTLFQMPQKCHEKYPCTKIFIPSFFKIFQNSRMFVIWKFFKSSTFCIIHFENVHMEKISFNAHSGLISIKMPTFSFILHQKLLLKLRNFIKKILQISPHSWFESMKVWFSRNFFVGQLFTGVFVCWVSLLLRILSFLRFYVVWKLFFEIFFKNF